jgi:hypothetical protein
MNPVRYLRRIACSLLGDTLFSRAAYRRAMDFRLCHAQRTSTDASLRAQATGSAE